MDIFVNGIQRSGTNYVTTLLKDNSNLEIVEYDQSGYWKHDIWGKPTDGILHNHFQCKQIITVLKNPYTWVESICFRNQVDIVEWFPQYNLRDENDYLGEWRINLRRLLTLYRDWYESWYEIDTIKVQYEKLLDKRDIKRFLGKELDIETKGIKLRDKVPYSDKIDKTRIEEYKQSKLKHLNQDHINIINEYIGEKLITKLGYKYRG